MPNFTGVIARPRLRVWMRGVERARPPARRSSKRLVSFSRVQIVVDAARPLRRAGRSASCRRRDRSCARGRRRRAARAAAAARDRISSITSMPCGPPKPRNAVCDVLCVRQTRPVTSTAGRWYALSQWKSERHMIGFGQVEAPAAVRVERQPAAPRAGRRREARRVARQKRMPLPGERHVERPRQAHAHRAPRLPRAERGDGRPGVRLHLLAAERAAHAQALDRHLVLGEPEHARDDLLRLGGMLRGRVHRRRRRSRRARRSRLRLEIEVLLAADRQLAVEAERARRESGHVAAREAERVGEEAPGGDRLLDGEDRGQRFVLGTARGPRPVARPRASRRAPTPPAGCGTSPRAETAARRDGRARCRPRPARRRRSAP